MSMELETVIESCLQALTSDPPHSRDEMFAMLNRWEEVGLINRQMRVVIIQRLRQYEKDEQRNSPLRS